MAKAISESTKRAFINEIAPLAVKAYKTLGKVLPSVCVGMACVESYYGTSEIMRKHNAFLGHKVGSGKTATKYWSGAFFNAKTSEEYTIGTHTAIKANFRSFKSAEQCIFNFYELLNTGLYAGVKAGADYRIQMQQIKACGYMTSSTEVSSVLSIIQKYGLTDLDGAPITPGWEEPSGKENEVKVHLNTLRKGDKSPQVKGLQFILSSIGYKVAVDGKYGDNTFKAIKAFQQAYSLIDDGVCGVNTWTKLIYEFFHNML